MSYAGASFILCEGYHDRAMWKQLLLSLGCVSLGKPEDAKDRSVRDPAGKSVRDGNFALQTVTGKYVQIAPARTPSRMPTLARDLMKIRRDMARMVVCVDSDQSADESMRKSSVIQGVRSVFLDEFGNDMVQATVGSKFRLGDCEVTAVDWCTEDTSDLPAVPKKQTLERVICLAMYRAYPQRAESIQRWLDSVVAAHNDADSGHHKAPLLSHLAAWYPDSASYEGLIARIWADEKVVPNLVQILTAVGIWSVAQEIAS